MFLDERVALVRRQRRDPPLGVLPEQTMERGMAQIVLLIRLAQPGERRGEFGGSRPIQRLAAPARQPVPQMARHQSQGGMGADRAQLFERRLVPRGVVADHQGQRIRGLVAGWRLIAWPALDWSALLGASNGTVGAIRPLAL